MEKNEIANINNMSDEQIMQAIGQDDGSSKGINIPRLGINRSPEDDDGNQLPVGHLFTYDSTVGQNVFGKPVTFRPFISAMQYMHYDPEKSEYVNRSIIFKNWKEEAIDILGGTKCGKIPFKERSSLTPEQLAEQRTIRCYRLLYGILSFNADANLTMSKEEMETLSKFQEVISMENTEVVALYNDAKKNNYTKKDAESATVISNVEDPAEVLSN